MLRTCRVKLCSICRSKQCLRLKHMGDLALTLKENLLRLCTALSTFSPSWMQWELKALSTFWDLAQNNCFQMGLQYLILFLKQLESVLTREGWHCYEKNQGFCPHSAESLNNCPLIYKESSVHKWSGHCRFEKDLRVYFQAMPEKLVRKGLF